VWFQDEALAQGYFRIWCALHQLDIMVRICVCDESSYDYAFVQLTNTCHINKSDLVYKIKMSGDGT
jgi:hypothetical protein